MVFTLSFFLFFRSQCEGPGNTYSSQKEVEINQMIKKIDSLLPPFLIKRQ